MTRPPPRGKAGGRFYALLALARKVPTMAQRFALLKQAEALRKGPSQVERGRGKACSTTGEAPRKASGRGKTPPT